MTFDESPEVELMNWHASMYMTVAGFVVLMYDWLITFADEVDFIWHGKVKIVKVLFLYNRYVTPIFILIDVYDKSGLSQIINDDFCRRWYLAEGVLTIITHAVAHWLVALRVIILYGNTRTMFWGYLVFFVAYFTSTMAVFVGYSTVLTPTVRVHPLLRICIADLPTGYVAVWIPGLVFEAVVFCMTLYRSWRMRSREIRTPLIEALFRGGVAYFLVVFMLTLFNVLVWTVAPGSLALLPRYFASALIVVTVSRLVLDLRGVGSHTNTTDDDGFEFSLHSLEQTQERRRHQEMDTIDRLMNQPMRRTIVNNIFLPKPPEGA